MNSFSPSPGDKLNKDIADALTVISILHEESLFFEKITWQQRNLILLKTTQLYETAGIRSSREILDFSDRIISLINEKVPACIYDSILNIIKLYYPLREQNRSRKNDIELASRCCSLAYELALKAKSSENLFILDICLEILRYVYFDGKLNSIMEIQNVAASHFESVSKLLDSQTDRANSVKLIITFKDALAQNDFRPLVITSEMYQLIQRDREKLSAV